VYSIVVFVDKYGFKYNLGPYIRFFGTVSISKLAVKRITLAVCQRDAMQIINDGDCRDIQCWLIEME
jgi:hypothetical protein